MSVLLSVLVSGGEVARPRLQALGEEAGDDRGGFHVSGDPEADGGGRGRLLFEVRGTAAVPGGDDGVIGIHTYSLPHFPTVRTSKLPPYSRGQDWPVNTYM